MALRDLIFKNLGLKIFSFAMATLIWLTVSFVIQSDTRKFTGLPVSVVSGAADVHNFRVSPSEVDVTVSGRIDALQRLQGRDLRVIVDLSDIESTREPRKRVEVSMPPGISLVEISPDQVDVTFPTARVTSSNIHP